MRPSYPPNPGAPKRAFPGKAEQAKQAEVEVKIELSRLLQSQRPEPKAFRRSPVYGIHAASF